MYLKCICIAMISTKGSMHNKRFIILNHLFEVLAFFLMLVYSPMRHGLMKTSGEGNGETTNHSHLGEA